MRYKLFAMGGYITKDGNRRILQLSQAMKTQEMVFGTMEQIISLLAPGGTINPKRYCVI